VPVLLDETPPARPPDHLPEVTVRVVTEPARAARRRLPAIGSVITTLVAGGVVVAALLVVGVVTGALHLGLFGTTTVDHSPPAVLKELNDLSRFTAAEGNYQSIVDVQDKVSILPSFLAGERTVFVAKGSVDANVDFAALGSDAVVVRGDHAVTITLPKPTLGKPVIDPNASRVVSQDRGLVNRVGDFFSNDANDAQRYYRMAAGKLTVAARSSALLAKAEKNTTTMLDALLGRLGFTDVTVTFAR
jgi:uncharacterized protein DUF4230